MRRKAWARWRGDLKSGQGTLSTESGAIQERTYSFHTRFEGEKGTNPEELIAAAHAGCFSMALAAELEKSGIRVEDIQTEAAVSLNKANGSWSIGEVHLTTKGGVGGEERDKFLEAANRAKENCPISRLLKAKITLDIKNE